MNDEVKERKEKKKTIIVGVCVCECFRAIDTMPRHHQRTCDNLTPNDIHRKCSASQNERRQKKIIISYSL